MNAPFKRPRYIWLFGLGLVLTAGWFFWKDKEPLYPPRRETLRSAEERFPKVIFPHLKLPDHSAEEAIAILNQQIAEIGGPSCRLRFALLKADAPPPPGLATGPKDLEAATAPDLQSRISLEFTNVPFVEAIRTIAEIADREIHVHNDMVWLYSKREFKEAAVRADYYLEGHLQLERLGDEVDKTAPQIDLKPFLTSNGMAFEATDVAYYDPNEKRVHLESSETNHDSFGLPFGLSDYFESSWERAVAPWKAWWFTLSTRLSPPIPIGPGNDSNLPVPAIPGLEPSLDPAPSEKAKP